MDPVRLLALRDTDVSVDEVYQAIRDPEAGGIAVFVGTVRDHDAGRDVLALDYSAHPAAEAAMRAAAEKIASELDVRGIAVVHRVGSLAIGDIAVIVGVSAPHRADAFDAARLLIDEVKRQTPIWKHQGFADGSDEWVGTP
ncbi:MAG TPA: molybdenum cofactor biosynthesis protein MoaE [Nocardioidaceae bacterium]|nr:molybdenum cofactor biosynthesis protein MoaE [Nocardioidaceae bacterium]